MNKETPFEILKSIDLFNLALHGKNVLTEAATNTYSVAPVIAARVGANVFAYGKESEYGKFNDIKNSIENLSYKLNVSENITIIKNLNEIDLHSIDVLTNTGFIRPINSKIIDKLSAKCVIPLMYEPWEFRQTDIDLKACYSKGIKVYGTNENDSRLKTMIYIGYNVLYLLLDNGKIPSSDYIIYLIGNKEFVNPVYKILSDNKYKLKKITEYAVVPDINKFDVIVVLEHKRNKLIIGPTGYINNEIIEQGNLIIHISGNIDIHNCESQCIPVNPRKFGYMSFLIDYISPIPAINLITAGFKVAEGMLKANNLGLEGVKYRKFMEKNYPALAFENPKFY